MSVRGPTASKGSKGLKWSTDIYARIHGAGASLQG